MWSPDLYIEEIALIAAMPLAKTGAATPPSSAARFCSSRVRVGFSPREYSYPVLAQLLLDIGGGWVDGRTHGAGFGVRLLANVDGARGKPGLLIAHNLARKDS